MYRGEWLERKQLPLKYGGISPCFRKEAGAHGKDTWGIFRIGDGFYFTFCYPGYEGVDLLNELIRYGISAIALDITGSHKQGIRACVALELRDQFPDLKERLEKFHADHPVK